MRGWILDLYPGDPGEMVVWLKREDGEAARLVDHWSPSIFIATDDRSDLTIPLQVLAPEFSWTRAVERRERVTDPGMSQVIEAKLRDAKRAQQVAGRMERFGPFGTFRLYNADVPPNQSYLYERDLFPLAYCEVTQTGDRLEWDLLDDVWKYDYRLPPLRRVDLDVSIAKQGKLARFTDRIQEIALRSDKGELRIDGKTEADKILGLVEAVKRADPDFVVTKDGDTFLLPYLVKRAEACRVADRLTLDRDGTVLRVPEKKGTSYFSYGRIHYKPSAMKLFGRVHIDANTSFAYSEAGFEGLFELSRICRMPLQTSSRASIGKALSSLQFYHASKMDLLVPWKPTLAERFKDRNELLLADRGGFIFEPKMGVHEGVAELDYSALYPNIMLRKNISAETVRCPCCPDSKNRVPELGWNVCERQSGIIPRAIEIVVKKRLGYKELKRNTKGAERDRYDARQAVLKWIGVTCLPGESPVMVRHHGVERCVKIGDFVDEFADERTGVIECPDDVFVAGLGEDLKAKYSRVANLIKKPNNQKLLSIEMENGRKITTTPDHPFFILQDGELTVTSAEELEPGQVIPVAKRIPSEPFVTDQVDLVERLLDFLSPEEQSLWRVSGECVKEHALTRRPELLKAAVSAGYSYEAVVSWMKNGIIPLRFLGLLGLAPSSHGALKIGVGRRLGGRIAWLPATIKMDEALGFLFGLYVADGSATRTYVRFDIALSEPGLLDTTRRLVKSVLGVSPRVYKERRARMYVVQVNNASFVRVLDRVFGLPGSASKGKLRVPDVIFNCRDRVAHRFIAGLIAGDGCASRQRKFVDIATASKDLQNQVGFLAAKLGLTFRLVTERESGQTLYSVVFVGPETLGTIASWEYSKENQRSRIQSWSEESPSTCNHPRYVRLPAAESGLFTLVKDTRTASEPHVRAESRTCPAQVKKKIERIRSRKLTEAQDERASGIKKLVDCDLGYVRIRKITQLESPPEHVYCFQLAEGELPGFFAGEGLIFTHNCFGYLGFNNAKFGRIDAHIAVCAWDRKVLLDSARVAERRDFDVIHGIVDSLWVKKEGASRDDYLQLKAEIEAETGFPMSFEGVYKWVAFLPSKTDPSLPVLNRYFGAYQDGELKVRGIEARRHDTPRAFTECQMRILRIMAEAGTILEVKAKVPECVAVFLEQAAELERHEVPASSLAFTTNLSKGPEEYTSMTVQHSAVERLAGEGAQLHAGEGIRYVITDYRGRDSKRATPVDMLEGESAYDSGRYVELLAETCASVLEPFAPECSAEGLLALNERRRSAPLA